jgi:hypothetical protein
VATVRDVVAETPRARTIVLDVDGWTRHRAAAQRLDAGHRRADPAAACS